jgi:hypothetical protein
MSTAPRTTRQANNHNGNMPPSSPNDHAADIKTTTACALPVFSISSVQLRLPPPLAAVARRSFWRIRSTVFVLPLSVVVLVFLQFTLSPVRHIISLQNTEPTMREILETANIDRSVHYPATKSGSTLLQNITANGGGWSLDGVDESNEPYASA